MRILEGNFNAASHKYALVVSRFNGPICQMLLDGAIDGLKRHGVHEKNIDIAWVPGAFELPLVAKKMAETGRYDGLICLGAIIRGETSHFDHVAGQCAAGIQQAALSTNIPIIFSVLTTETKDQAEMRAGIKGINLGFAGALSAIETVNVIKLLHET